MLNNSFNLIKKLICLRSSNCISVKSFCWNYNNIIALGSGFLCCFLVFFTPNKLTYCSQTSILPCRTLSPCISCLCGCGGGYRITLIFLLGCLFATISPFSAALEFAFSLHLPWLWALRQHWPTL